MILPKPMNTILQESLMTQGKQIGEVLQIINTMADRLVIVEKELIKSQANVRELEEKLEAVEERLEEVEEQ